MKRIEFFFSHIWVFFLFYSTFVESRLTWSKVRDDSQLMSTVKFADNIQIDTNNEQTKEIKNNIFLNQVNSASLDAPSSKPAQNPAISSNSTCNLLLETSCKSCFKDANTLWCNDKCYSYSNSTYIDCVASYCGTSSIISQSSKCSPDKPTTVATIIAFFLFVICPLALIGSCCYACCFRCGAGYKIGTEPNQPMPVMQIATDSPDDYNNNQPVFATAEIVSDAYSYPSSGAMVVGVTAAPVGAISSFQPYHQPRQNFAQQPPVAESWAIGGPQRSPFTDDNNNSSSNSMIVAPTDIQLSQRVQSNGNNRRSSTSDIQSQRNDAGRRINNAGVGRGNAPTRSNQSTNRRSSTGDIPSPRFGQSDNTLDFQPIVTAADTSPRVDAEEQHVQQQQVDQDDPINMQNTNNASNSRKPQSDNRNRRGSTGDMRSQQGSGSNRRGSTGSVSNTQSDSRTRRGSTGTTNNLIQPSGESNANGSTNIQSGIELVTNTSTQP